MKENEHFSILFDKEAFFISDQPLGYFQMQLSVEFLVRISTILKIKQTIIEYELID